MSRAALALLCFAGCAGTAGHADGPPAANSHRLVVNLRGAGSVVGTVVSDPPGLTCELAPNSGGTNETQCEASLPAGQVTLTFSPGPSGGPASVAQFSVVRGDQREMCEGKNASTTCTLALDRELHVDVFPISVPPPPPP
jgi:hypothetical protein